MNGNPQNFNTNLFRSILAENENANAYKSADLQRKTMALVFEAACKSSDNAISCNILEARLDEYTKTVVKDGQSIYNSLLLEAYPNLALRRNPSVSKELPEVNFNSLVNSLNCNQSSKFNCKQSEEVTEFELEKFASLFANGSHQKQTKSLTTVNRCKIPWEEKRKNLIKLQRSNSNEQRPSFISASEELENQIATKFKVGGNQAQSHSNRPKNRPTSRKFICPLLSNKEDSSENMDATNDSSSDLKNVDPKMVELIKSEIMDKGLSIGWDDIAGLEFAKSCIKESVVWPMLRPDIFKGLRRPPKGILLFGPPGTGKTLIGKCVASQSKSTFFSISASSLTSKWIGDAEKMVRTLFAVARVHQPAVIFIDEIDSLLTQRNANEHECSRRMKTEFLVQLDGATTDSEEKLLVIGATNRPQELDEAARRRFVKRLYIPLPEYEGRLDLLKKLMSTEKHSITEEQFVEIAMLSAGYSGADIKNLCSEAALGSIRSIDFSKIEMIEASEVRPITMEDFESSLRSVKPSVSQNDLTLYVSWNNTFGSGGPDVLKKEGHEINGTVLDRERV